MSEEYAEKQGRWFNGWHLDKRFHIGNILTIVVLAVSVALYVNDTENKAEDAINMIKSEKEARIAADEQIRSRMERRNERLARDLKQIQESLVRIEEKMYQKNNENNQ